MTSPHELAAALLKRAVDDAYVVARLWADDQSPDWIIGFHAQQAVEKAIKAVLAGANVLFPRTHNIAMLLALLHQHRIPAPEPAAALENLTPFGIAARYEDCSDESFPLDREMTRTQVELTLSWARSIISSSGSTD
jgi:HEPN domain-containing protein